MAKRAFKDSMNSKPINPFVIYNPIRVFTKSRVESVVRLSDIPGVGDINPSPNVRKIVSEYSMDISKSISHFKISKDDDRFMNMSSASIKFFYILSMHIPYKEDIMYINLPKYIQLTKLSRVTVLKAINELIDNSILSRYKNGYYWINPHVCFFGSRVAKYAPEGYTREYDLKGDSLVDDDNDLMED